VQSFLVLVSLPIMAFILPLAATMSLFGLADSLGGLVLAQTALYAPLAAYVLVGYLAREQGQLEDAARIDGAGPLRILWSVVLPLAAPGIAATAVVLFVLNWNVVLVPLVLTLKHIRTLMVAMIDFFTFERELEWPTAAAALVVTLAPLLVFVGLAHRALEQFTLAGAADKAEE
jgi:raffinose/stachyose/melibiose transport system permease protein